MGRDLKQEVLAYLLKLADENGYVTFDNIIDCTDEKSLPIQDIDWLSSAITTRGILVYDETPTGRIDSAQDCDDFDDYAQSDYEAAYDRIIELDKSLEPFVAKVRNIKPPQWRELTQLKYQVFEGNTYARSRMIEMHLRIALKIALQRTENFDMDIVDAVGEACIGLVTAVDKYNPDINGAFGSYAAMWILQNISRRQPTQCPLVYYPVHKKDIYFTAYLMLKEIGYFDEVPSLDSKEANNWLQVKMEIYCEQADEILAACTPFESYEKLYFEYLENDCADYLDIPTALVSDDNVEELTAQTLLKEQLQDVLDTLGERDKFVVQLRYGLIDGKEKTLEEVGNELGVTRERVRQIEAKALRKLQQPSRIRKLKDY
jgi:RNA polymerase primary sigma factor